MNITTEQAAAWFENRLRDTPMKGAREMCKIAAAALREKAEREDPKPLTIEELQGDDFPFWVKILSMEYCDIYWPAIKDSMGGVDFAIWCRHERERLLFSDYGDTWIAYRHKPKEVQG